MITNWDVLTYVADHYGPRKEKFNTDLRNLKAMQDDHGSPLDLEQNETRIKFRLAREGEGDVAIERIMGTVDYQDVYILARLHQLSKSVCRIKKNDKPIGTGFLVAENIIITNHHVIQNEKEAGLMTAEFEYELKPPPHREIPETAEFDCDPDTFFLTSPLYQQSDIKYSGLDFSLVALKPKAFNGKLLKEYNPVFLDGNLGKIIKGENCVIIQHPEGKPKKVSLRNSAFFSETDTRIIYETDTQPGSSGSMVVALGTGEVFALHHAGLPRTDKQNRILTKDGTPATNATPDIEIDWIGNQGIKVSKIVEAIQGADLPEQMEAGRAALIKKTSSVSKKLDAVNDDAVDKVLANKPKMKSQKNVAKPDRTPKETPGFSGSESDHTPKSFEQFIIIAKNTGANIELITTQLKGKYGQDIQFRLLMPSTAVEGAEELFLLKIPGVTDAPRVVKELIVVMGVINAEWDRPLSLNATPDPSGDTGQMPSTESIAGLIDDGFGNPNEPETIDKYTLHDKKSKYIKRPKDEDDEETILANRSWNWVATNFSEVVNAQDVVSPAQTGIKVVQFDTGYSNHTKVAGGFNTNTDFDFVGDDDTPDDAKDSNTTGFLKMPGHGTRTGSLLIGRKDAPLENNGNGGLLEDGGIFTLTPYRIAKSVIIIDRQAELAAALDRAIQQGFDIITMSMGLPPTIATARMAKKAYDSGVIWCSAAGNEVKFVVAPAVYPGTIAVAASNPLDELWKGSSRGSTVDITAPGEDVYVPIVFRHPQSGDTLEGFAYGNGTSYATPHVAAAAAFWLAKYKDELNKPEYRGWRRVEAFRKALKDSARKQPKIKEKGHGAGILDAEKLMATVPKAPSEKDYAYNAFNEIAFFAKLQGLAEIGKTFWNELHGRIFGKKKNSVESFETSEVTLSEEDRLLAATLFGTAGIGTQESTGFISDEELQANLEKLNDILFDEEN